MAAAAERRPGLILDRDGVINVDTGFMHRQENCEFIDGIFDLVRVAKSRGFALVIATNQSGIGRGLFSEAAFWSFMDWMQREFEKKSGTHFDKIYQCPDHPRHGIGPYKRDSNWRKPAPGMFHQAIADLNLNPDLCWAIGDKPDDLEAADRAGIAHRVLLNPEMLSMEWYYDHWVTPDLPRVTQKIREFKLS